jgi:hypothetical protein
MGELEVEAAIAHVLRRAQILGLLLKKSSGPVQQLTEEG